MRKISIIIVFVFCALIFSCDMMIIDDFWSNNCPENFHDYSIIDICNYSIRHIKYVSDIELFNRFDYTETPQEIENRKKGDCDEFCLWTLSILYRDKGIKGDYLRVDSSGDGIIDHAMIRVNGKDYLKAKNYNSYKVIECIPFDEIPYQMNR